MCCPTVNCHSPHRSGFSGHSHPYNIMLSIDRSKSFLFSQWQDSSCEMLTDILLPRCLCVCMCMSYVLCATAESNLSATVHCNMFPIKTFLLSILQIFSNVFGCYRLCPREAISDIHAGLKLAFTAQLKIHVGTDLLFYFSLLWLTFHIPLIPGLVGCGNQRSKVYKWKCIS